MYAGRDEFSRRAERAVPPPSWGRLLLPSFACQSPPERIKQGLSTIAARCVLAFSAVPAAKAKRLIDPGRRFFGSFLETCPLPQSSSVTTLAKHFLRPSTLVAGCSA